MYQDMVGVDEMDKEYVKARNKLIPEAEAWANDCYGRESAYEWTRCFLRAMNRLAFKVGLVSWYED